MSDIIERNLIADSIEVRESAEGRRVCGLAAPFDKSFDAGDYVERFAPGAFAKSIQERGDRIPLLEAHRRDAMPLGKATRLEETSHGLYAEFLMSRTGRVGFVPVRDTRRETADGRPLVQRDEVKLHHVGLISEVPAYADARVLAVREFDPDDETSAPKLAVWRARLLTL